MYYVYDDDEIIAEFETYYEAEEWMLDQSDADNLWISSDYNDYDDVDEFGFNPYMGCYDYDC